MSHIPQDWVCVASAIPMHGAYLVYTYVDDSCSHQDDPDAYGTLKRWRAEERAHYPSVRFKNRDGIREAWAPRDETDFDVECAYDNTGAWSIDHGGSGS